MTSVLVKIPAISCWRESLHRRGFCSSTANESVQLNALMTCSVIFWLLNLQTYRKWARKCSESWSEFSGLKWEMFSNKRWSKGARLQQKQPTSAEKPPLLCCFTVAHHKSYHKEVTMRVGVYDCIQKHALCFHAECGQ